MQFHTQSHSESVVEQFGAKIWAPAVAELEKINSAVRAVRIDIL